MLAYRIVDEESKYFIIELELTNLLPFELIHINYFLKNWLSYTKYVWLLYPELLQNNFKQYFKYL